MKVAFYAQEIRHIQYAKKHFRDYHRGRLHVAIDYYQDIDRLYPVLLKKCYDLIMVFEDSLVKDELNTYARLRELNRDGVIMMISGRSLGKLSYYYGEYLGFFNRCPVILNLRDIYGLESSHRMTYIRTENQKIRITARLNEEEKRLPATHFFRVNQGCILNMQYIRRLEGSDIIMDNGMLYYVSYRRKADFLIQYRKYTLENYGVSSIIR